MKYASWVVVSALAAVLMVACERQEVGLSRHEPRVGERPQTAKTSGGDEEPLLLLDEEPPLLLDGNEESAAPKGPVADNSRCHVCHLNYAREELAVQHARANIGCADCHGNCDEHIADESWAWGENGTPPGIMYPRPKINPFCLNCHPKDKIPAAEHKALFAGTSKKKYCTDCHGAHRLPKRKCKWK